MWNDKWVKKLYWINIFFNTYLYKENKNKQYELFQFVKISWKINTINK